MTLQQFQDYLHAEYQGDTTTPDEGDDDWNLREILLYEAIDAWDNEQGILWSELWKLRSGDAAQLTAALTLAYATPTDFRFPGGFVRLGASAGAYDFYAVKKPEEIELTRNVTAKFVFFTGNERDGFYLNFLSQPTAAQTIDYPYYKEPFKPTAAAHVIEMSDPWFAIYLALSKLHEQDGEGDRATLALSKAQSRLNNMKTRNIMPTWFNSNVIPDAGYVLGRGGFGR